MADMRLLERTLQENVTWNRARINFLARFIIALIEVRTVNLSEIANVFAGRAQPASHSKRVQRFLRFFGYHSVSYLCADREFVGRDWFSWLRPQRIDFRIRVRENTKVENGRGELVSAWRLFRSQRINEALVIERARSLRGLPLFLS